MSSDSSITSLRSGESSYTGFEATASAPRHVITNGIHPRVEPSPVVAFDLANRIFPRQIVGFARVFDQVVQLGVVAEVVDELVRGRADHPLREAAAGVAVVRGED